MTASESPLGHNPKPGQSLYDSSRSRLGISGRGLYARVVEDVGQRIINGELPVGSIIFAEHLCDRLGISRSVVREGLRTLSSMGLLESRPQLGTRVLPREHWDLLNPYVVRWRGQGPDYVDQMQELLELRLGIEHAAAHFAASRMPEDGIQRLLEAARTMAQAFKDRDTYTFFKADAELHRLLLEGSGNAIIAQFADTVSAALQLRGSYNSRSYAAHDINEASVGRHLELAEALSRRDPVAAQDAADAIILATLTEVEALLV